MGVVDLPCWTLKELGVPVGEGLQWPFHWNTGLGSLTFPNYTQGSKVPLYFQISSWVGRIKGNLSFIHFKIFWWEIFWWSHHKFSKFSLSTLFLFIPEVWESWSPGFSSPFTLSLFSHSHPLSWPHLNFRSTPQLCYYPHMGVLCSSNYTCLKITPRLSPYTYSFICMYQLGRRQHLTLNTEMPVAFLSSSSSSFLFVFLWDRVRWLAWTRQMGFTSVSTSYQLEYLLWASIKMGMKTHGS